MHCAYFQAGRCRSCSQIELAYPQQLLRKQATAQAALQAHVGLDWLAPWDSAEAGFRNKAKMMVGGSVESPTLGILDSGFTGIDLSDCLLYPDALACSFQPLRDFIRRAALVPYDVRQRSGELKHLLITVSPASAHPLLLRFVCRTTEPMERIRKHLPWLQRRLPQLQVVSLNLLPEHKAASEGAEETMLTTQHELPMPINDLPLYLRPRSFFQTNTSAAAALYRQAQRWITRCAPASVLDLYCGVGGFALHAAAALPETTPVRGVEISADAIACAERSAKEMQLGNVGFTTLDASTIAKSFNADLVIVNPPRRGIGATLCGQIDAADARWLIYSSCSVDSMVADLARMPGWIAREARLLDMFPHTAHFEIIMLLERRT